MACGESVDKLFLRPVGACLLSALSPTACAPSTGPGQAVGCDLSPLRGWVPANANSRAEQLADCARRLLQSIKLGQDFGAVFHGIDGGVGCRDFAGGVDQEGVALGYFYHAEVQE